jgi:hypothetical protein
MILALAFGALLQAGSSQPPQTKADSITADVMRRLRVQDSIRATRIALAAMQVATRPRRREVTEKDLATAFKDPAAKNLLERARVARLGQDSALNSYDAQSYQRISAGISFSRIGRDRLIFRMEHAGRVRWQRGVGIWIDLTGARTALPGTPDIAQREAGKGIAEAGGEIVPVPYFPGYEPLWAGPLKAEENVDENGPVHPLANGAEAYYTYRTGDSITLTLPDGRAYHLKSLDIRPRMPDWNLMVGSLWFDAASAQLVRAAYRFAAPMRIDEFVLEQDPTAFDDVPAFVKPMMFPLKGEISAVTIEYGLYGSRFWLPRSRSAEGHGIASFVRVPFRLEQTFKYSAVNGADSLPRIPIANRNNTITIRTPPGLSDSARRAWRDSSLAVILGAQRARRDSIRDGLLRAPLRLAQCDTSIVRVHTDRRYGQSDIAFATRVPCDKSVLETSPDLPPSIFDPGEELFDLKARDALITEALSMSAQSEFTLNPARLPRPEWQPWLGAMRYNRVEGLSAGAQVSQTVGGGYSGHAAGRFGLADRKPNVELSVTRTNLTHTLSLGAYTKLVSASDWGSPLNFGSSLSALLFGRDEGFYYRATGVEFGGRTERTPLMEWRLFSEKQQAAGVATTFALGGDNALANIAATGSTYFGTKVRVRASHGDDPMGFRVLGDMRMESAVTNDSVFARGALDLTVMQGVGKWGGALTLSGGSSLGDVPAQRRWYLGGMRTIRGQTPDTAQSGNAFWMSRLEVGRVIQGARPVIFTDLGWAGDRTQWRNVGRYRPMSGIGVGASMLDGLIRFDVTRGIYPRKQMRVDAYFEGVF